MITFRCWYCGRRYAVPETRVGRRIACSCKHELKVPKRSGGRCKVRRPMDWLVESVVYGGGGALFGFGIAMVLVFQTRLFQPGRGLEAAAVLVAGLTVAGFLLGVLGGERGINWVGRMVREREEDQG